MNTGKKILILGTQGMAGHIMAEVFSHYSEFNVYGIARTSGRYVDMQLDVTDFSCLSKYIESVSPDYVINCVGALVSKSAENLPFAILVNSYLPNFLAQQGILNDFKLIHISTDCVFSGSKGAYKEDDFRDGDDNYARTKALGEVDTAKHLTIRTSIIGPELKSNGTGLLDWFLKQNGKIYGYTHAFWSGVTTLELAKATMEFIKQDITGLYHLCPSQKISKYELLQLFAKIWGKAIQIDPYDQYKVDKSLQCTRDDFHYRVPSYESMLLELKQWMDEHPEYYHHYK